MMLNKFKHGDRVVHYGRLGRIDVRTWTRGVYYVDFDDGKVERVYESELSLFDDGEVERWENEGGHAS